MKILCDDREKGETVKELLLLKCDVEVCRLKCGDYVCGDVCIERKSIDDFCGSIIDGRIKKQAENMINNYKHNFVLIYGYFKDRTTEIRENCILGMISSLLEKGINVVCVENERQLAFLLKRLVERFNSDKS